MHALSPARHASPLSSLVLLLVLAAVWLIQPGQAWSASGNDYLLHAPQGWRDRTDGLSGDLIRQIIEPGQNAFIEVYSGSGSNPGLECLADRWEIKALRTGLPYVTAFEGQSALNLTGGVPALVRRYSGANNNIPISSRVIFTHHRNRVYVVLGVWVKEAAGLKDRVNGVLNGFGFRKPSGGGTGGATGVGGITGGTTGGVTSGGSGRSGAPPCSIVGKWKWFTGSVAEFLPNGRVKGSSNSTWHCKDAASRTIIINWSNGKYIDTLTLSKNGMRLDGKNQFGHTVWGRRIGDPPLPGASTGSVSGSGEGSAKRQAAAFQYVHSARYDF